MHRLIYIAAMLLILLSACMHSPNSTYPTPNSNPSSSNTSNAKPSHTKLFHTKVPSDNEPKDSLHNPASSHNNPRIHALCREIGQKLGSVSDNNCHALQLQDSSFYSVKNRSLAIKDYPAHKQHTNLGRVFVIGGIHGDEYAATSIVFKWMQQLEQERDGRLHWRFMPLSNPDGLLQKKSQRQNANGVDLNRNFPSQDWTQLAHRYWQTKTYKNPRRYPGKIAASEPETQALIQQINQFKPDIIVSVHAPYHLLDYDGPSKAPKRIGKLHLHELGVYPGSLGNYGGVDLKLPVITLELPSAGIMPSPQEIQAMWKDLNSWLLRERLQVAKLQKKRPRPAQQLISSRRVN